MKNILFAVTIIFFTSSCQNFSKNKDDFGDEEKTKMINADKAFSKMCVEKGVKVAFLEYIDSNGVLLRPNQIPLVGADAIDFLSQQGDTSYTLQWAPKSAMLAKSGDLGFTYGIYSLKTATTTAKTLYGTYVSIWKKQPNGSWKFILDSGNEGVGEPVQEP